MREIGCVKLCVYVPLWEFAELLIVCMMFFSYKAMYLRFLIMFGYWCHLQRMLLSQRIPDKQVFLHCARQGMRLSFHLKFKC